MAQDSAPLVEVRGLDKRYPAFTLEDVSFAVGAGSITGFIGRNGTGKSTTLKCLEGSVHPDAGSVTYFGCPFANHEEQAKRLIGFELGGADFYRNKRVSAIAAVTRRFYDNWDQGAFENYCRLFSIDQAKRVKELSQGMRVKFAVPTSGLDPASREEVLDVFLQLAREKNVGILFSTHITSDLDKCADHIVYIENGRIIGSGALTDFKDSYRVAPLAEAKAAGAQVIGARARFGGHRRGGNPR